RHAVFELVTTPSGIVRVDGRVRGETPLELQLDPGTHELSVESDGHKSWSQTITLAAGDRRRVDVFLTAEGTEAPVRTETVEKDAVAEEETVPARPTRRAQPERARERERVERAEVEDPPPEQEPEPVEEPTVETLPVKESNTDEKTGLLPVDERPGSLLPVD
ncbi:MAG: PEGA domain-containing protein, partial [Halobacteriales archaeon]|nr:PEGA domain-containing protein [Halobacteriales archaeon]